MLRIYLTRHGQSEDNANNVFNHRLGNPLTELGQKQAIKLTKKLKALKIIFDKVYCSPLERALETARVVSSGLGLPEPEVSKNLSEREFGDLEGKKLEDIAKLCSKTVDIGPFIYCLIGPNVEPFPKLFERAKKVLEEIKRKHKKGNILLVSHGDIGKMLFAVFYKLSWLKTLKMFNFGNCELIILSKINPKKSKLISEEQYNA